MSARPVDPSAVRPATAADATMLYRICLLTGDAGRDASSLHAAPLLLGEIYVGPYLHVDPAIARMAVEESGEPLGYVVGTPDTTALAVGCQRLWWPALRARHPRRPGPGEQRTQADQQLVELLHDPPTVPAALVAEFPAHLHIDLLPAAQGRGVGRQLVEVMLGELHDVGASGVHLGVDPRNRHAIAFYEHLGFGRWRAGPDEVTLVRPLP